jgi:hypothetical protein
MKVRVPIMIQDPMTARYKGMKLVEGFYIIGEDVFLDGPVTRRVAVLDFDPDTGALVPGVRFRPPPPGRVLGAYEIEDEEDIYSPGFLQVNALATVLRTLAMFEREDTLGRRVSWAFDGPQLLVVPRAGEWANAYYERDSHSLQLFYFKDPGGPGQVVYTALSRDIVAHETGHAILDGIAPDLYHAVTPQSLALHEAIADLTALLMAFQSHTLRKTVLDQTGGSIENSTAFSSVAEEFGRACDPDSPLGCLRSLLNRKNLRKGDPDCVTRNEPHELSEVLSGALYSVMVRIHEKLKEAYSGADSAKRFTVSGKALAVGANRLKCMVFRALDYLPPGEVSFADMGRAILAVDQAAYPDEQAERNWMRDEFVTRCMVPDAPSLGVQTNFQHPALDGIDLQTLVDSDWAAYDFANRNRELLSIPSEIPFKVRPRQDVTKLYHHTGGNRKVRECLFKVSWDHVEKSPTIGRGFPSRRRVTVGTTLAIDWDTRTIRAHLTSDRSNRPEELREQREDRDLMLRRLADEDLLELSRHGIGPDEKPLRSVVRAESTQGVIRVRGTGRMLHIARRR